MRGPSQSLFAVRGPLFQKEACLNQGTILVEHSHCLQNGDICLPGLEVGGWGRREGAM